MRDRVHVGEEGHPRLRAPRDAADEVSRRRIGPLGGIVLYDLQAEPFELDLDPVRHLALMPRLRRDLAQAREGFEEPLAHAARLCAQASRRTRTSSASVDSSTAVSSAAGAFPVSDARRA